jgi:hypothetical protein
LISIILLLYRTKFSKYVDILIKWSAIFLNKNMEVKDAPVETDMPEAPVFSDPELSALIVVIDRLFSKGGIEGKEAHAMVALRTK